MNTSRHGRGSWPAAAALLLCGLLATGPGLRAADADRIGDPGAFLAQTENLRITDHAQFARQLALVHSEAPPLTPAQRWHLDYLDAFELSLQGKYDSAEPLLRTVIRHAGDAMLVSKASALLMSNLAVRHRYLEAFTIAHQLTTDLPKITDPDFRNEVLGNLSQMLTLAGQSDLAIQYALMMESTTTSQGGACKARFRLLAAEYSAKRLNPSDARLQEAAELCAGEHQPIVKVAVQLMLVDLMLGDHQTAAALALLDRVTPEIKQNHYFPHLLSAQVQRAEAYGQLGRTDDAKQAALAAINAAAPDTIDNWLMVAYKLLFDDAKRRGDLAGALSYYEQYVRQEKGSIDDSAAQALAYQTVQQQVLTRKLETEELGKQNSILKLQRALDAKEVEAGRLYITLLLIVLAAIVLWLFRLKRSQLRFKKLASHDGLTGILNHQHFIGECARILRLLEKRGGPAGLVSIDLDHFKLINDTYGHAMGDTVLRHAVAVCMEHLRPGDLFGRLGGEEFGVLLVDCGRDQSLAIADRIRMAILAEPLDIDGQTIAISASVGMAFTGSAGYNLQRLCRDADAALYRAKRSGRNRVASDIQDGDLVGA